MTLRLLDELWSCIATCMDHDTLCTWRLTCKFASGHRDEQLRTLTIGKKSTMTALHLITLTYLTKLSLYTENMGFCYLVVSALTSLQLLIIGVTYQLDETILRWNPQARLKHTT